MRAGHMFTRLKICVDFVDTWMDTLWVSLQPEFPSMEAEELGGCFPPLKRGGLGSGELAPGETWELYLSDRTE